MGMSTEFYVHLLVVWCGLSSVSADSHSDDYDVIILGAGMAGVSAARTLVSEGVTNFLMLEGRGEVGGRMQSQQFGDYIVERGAQWIQVAKQDSENPVYRAAVRFNMSVFPTDYTDLMVYDEQGNDLTTQGKQVFGVLDETWDKMVAYGEKLWENRYRDDISIRGSFRWFGFKPETPLEMACEYFYTEFESAEQTGLISNRYFIAADVVGGENFGDEDYLIVDQRGYSNIPKSILADDVPDWEDKLRLETVVTAINYTDSHVVVTTDNGTFIGKKVISTFSLGVLQTSMVQFYPSLPEWKLQALHAFGMNDYVHVHVRFNPNIIWFVPYDTEWILYASPRRGYFPVWHNVNKAKPESHMLQAAVTGHEARRLQRLSDSEIQQEVMVVLREMFGNEVPEAEEILLPRLHSDPFFRGSYSDWPVGYTRAQHKALQASVGPVHFAGEAFSSHYFGYVHGALLSGQDEAQAVAECLRDEAMCRESYVPPYAALGCTYRLAINYNPQAQIDDGSCMIVARAPPASGSAAIRGTVSVIICLMALLLL